MKREEKQVMIDDLSKRLDENNIIYIADISNLDAVATSSLRRQCFAKNIKLSVVKNTLLKKAMENVQEKTSQNCMIFCLVQQQLCCRTREIYLQN